MGTVQTRNIQLSLAVRFCTLGLEGDVFVELWDDRRRNFRITADRTAAGMAGAHKQRNPREELT
jgi:hypothetical protein